MFSQEMTSTIASCRLWCREGDSLLEFEIELGTPYKNREKWFCDWAIGDINMGLMNSQKPAPSETSLHALIFAQTAILGALELKGKLGATFFTDATEMHPIEDLRAFLPSLQPRSNRECRRERRSIPNPESGNREHNGELNGLQP